MKKKKILKSILLTSSVLLGFNFMNIKTSYAEEDKSNILLEGAKYRDEHGSNYWHTSNLREWLNSSGKVNYTNLPPTKEKLGDYGYADENGFLSSFSQSENEAIAVTNVSSMLSWSDRLSLNMEGNQIAGVFNATPDVSFDVPNLLGDWNSLTMKKDNDKVFVLSPKEIIQYYQNRGWDIIKSVTPQVRQKFGLTVTNYNYFTRSARSEGYIESMLKINADRNNPISECKPLEHNGVCPAMHLKLNQNVHLTKEYVQKSYNNFRWNNVDKMVKTQDLKIGDIITFGTYLGQPIEWRVINISENGQPLIATEHIIDLKPYDAPGDRAYKNSNITFDKYDTELNPDYMRNIENNSDNILPQIKVLNEDELHKRQVGSFTLNIEVKDNSGISKVILPDGNVLNNPSNSFNYKVSNNGFYYFKVYDTYGNCKNYVIPVGNINLETSVVVNQSTKEWTNKPVDISIKASNDVVLKRDSININGRDSIIYEPYPNYTSYAGKKFKISADVELKYAKKDVGDNITGLGFMYYYTTKDGDNYVRHPNWVYATTYKLSDLQKNGKQHIDVIYTVPENYFNDLLTWLQINVDHTERAFDVEYTNIKYELLDDSNFKITKIVLPNNKEINDKEYSYTIDKEGDLSHTYKVYDNRNMITNKKIETKIDMTKPNIEPINLNTNWTNKDVSVDIKFSDELSGLKEVITPFNDYSLGGDKTFTDRVTFNKNGKYYFKAIDLAGNEYIKEINITNIDKDKPNVKVDKVISKDTNGNYLNIKVSDNGQLDKIILPNGEETSNPEVKYPISKNGNYLINVKDKASNINTISVNVNELNVENRASGIGKIEYKLSGATVKDWTTYDKPFYISNEGITYITARSYDNAGNISSEETSEVKVDKTSPTNNKIKIQLK